MRLATVALISFVAGSSAAPALSQTTPGSGGRDTPVPAVPGGDLPGGGAPGDRIPEEIRPPAGTSDDLPGAPTVPGRDKLGAPSSAPGHDAPAARQTPSTGRATPDTPGAMPGRDKLGTPSVPGK